LVLKLAVPGIADIYQGGELWDFNLVDPDNRRPIDWERCRTLLSKTGAAGFAALGSDWRDGREKLFVTHRLVQLRRHHPELFAAGDYRPLDAIGGQHGDHLCAFVRRHGETMLVSAIADWGTTELALSARAAWRDVFTGREWAGCERIPVSDLLADFAVAVFVEVTGS
jgi:(1->4)-alpha-D-glucan 1-alpha-D-glucosylmutase